ncbi:MAG: hypothetical protein N3B13_09205 [Deltaproteobacteria bacterium]|nr:hypothetical protein [Deltaproteobacteria bacterium]
MKNTGLITAFLIIFATASYFISQSFSAGLFTGIFSLFLIRLFLFAMVKTGNIRFIIILLNIIKFGIVILMLYIFIRWLKLDAIMIAAGYTAVFLLTVTEIFVRRPKEL